MMLFRRDNSNFFLLLFILFFSACSENNDSQEKRVEKGHTQKVAESILTISWDDLIPEQYRPEKIMAKYQSELDRLEGLGDEESYSKLDSLYRKLDAEMRNMPANETIDNKRIKLPGFIAPLNNHNGLITEFLLVPYFGACIHVPPPPTNQTVLVKVAPDNGIKPEDAYIPYWVSGTIRIMNEQTDIGESGFRINNAITEVYRE